MDTKREQLDRLLADYNCKNPEGLIGENGLLKQITKIILEQALQDDLIHLGDQRMSPLSPQGGRDRNGTTKPLIGNFGKPRSVPPHESDLVSAPALLVHRPASPVDVNDKIIALYVRGMSPVEIQGHLKKVSGIDVSAGTISAFTESVASELKSWRNRPLEGLYPIVYIDFVRAKVLDKGLVVTRVVCLAIGIAMDGVKDVLGMWVGENEGADFCRRVLAELKNRGVHDMLIVCVDGPLELSETAKMVLPDVQVQPYVASMVRNCLKYVSWKERKEMVSDLKAIYQAATSEQAQCELNAFAKKWDESHPAISQAWRRNWERILPLFTYSEDVRKVIYTTNTIESLHMALCKVTKDRRAFPDDLRLLQLLYLTLNNATKKWSMPVRDWKAALNRFSILFGDRMPVY
ncbi:MAG: transposase mutator [Desulfobulbaceae bacterium]|nr:MAG: transposase mutator [Desulfobulbaceae bacterium]